MRLLLPVAKWMHHNQQGTIREEPTTKDKTMGCITMMKKISCLAVVILGVAAPACTQVSTEPATANSPAAAAKAPTPADAPASGTILSVELSKSLDAKKVKANDRVEARTATDLLAHGQIVVPRNTKIVGHVTEAKARSKASPDSIIGITFDRMQLKDGREVPLQLTVQAIARPLQFSSPEGNVQRSDRPGVSMPGQRGPIGDASTQGVPSAYPGDLAPIPDPMAPNRTSDSTVVPLSPTSKGVVGIKGLNLDTSGPAAVLSSNTGNVHLESGAQLILRVQ
jgi:hypothetical protein